MPDTDTPSAGDMRELQTAADCAGLSQEFAALVFERDALRAALGAEREACAKLCEERAAYYDAGDDDRPDSRRALACRACATVIRASKGAG